MKHEWKPNSGTTDICARCGCVRFMVDKRGRLDSNGGFYRYSKTGNWQRAYRDMPACPGAK
jgi:hypothetical protein